ncbi:hypothetical protein BC828DRAFT_404881 [Blastocladiella britannica]|nr:hypothetical protein BC828DRAFT_404881 [Blastocladiella britannica]
MASHRSRVLVMMVMALVVALLAATATAQDNSSTSSSSSSSSSSSRASTTQSSSSSRSTATQTSTDSTSTDSSTRSTRTFSSVSKAKATDDPCANGVCDVGGGRGTCVMMEKSKICPAFKGMYLPVDVRPYFTDNFPLKLTASLPIINNITVFEQFFARTSDDFVDTPYYSFMYLEEFMLFRAGCIIPTQQWYRTWWCMDMIDYFSTKGDKCTAGLAPKMCGSTLDQRALSVQRDISNGTTCHLENKFRPIGYQYGNATQNHRFRTSDPGCISGESNEQRSIGDAQVCGFQNPYYPCKQPSLCPNLMFAPSDDKTCKTEINAQEDAVPQLNAASDPLDKDPSHANTYIMIGLGIMAAFAAISGLVAMNGIRRRGAALDKHKEDAAAAAAAASAAAAAHKPSPLSQSGSAAHSSSATNLLAASGAQQQPPMPAYMPGASMGGGYAPVPNVTPAPTPVPGYGPPPAQQQYQQAPPLQPSAVSFAPAPPVAIAQAPAQLQQQQQAAAVQIRAATIAYQAAQGDELSIVPGDQIEVVQVFDDGWAKGRHVASGRVGFFPYACVQQGQVVRSAARYSSLGRR